MKKVVMLLLVLVVTICAAGCSPKATEAPVTETTEAVATDAVAGTEVADATETAVATEAPAYELSDKVFNAALTAGPQSLDEGYSTNTHTRQVSVYIFETLFTFDDNFAVMPQLVDTYTMSDDGLTYDIVLRQGITFHDGSDFTAEDVIASIERYKTNVQYGKTLDDITAMDIISDYEIKFTLATAFDLPSVLAFPQRVVMMPKEVAERNMGTELQGADIIGTGPYKLVEWVPDVHVQLERFEEYVPDTRYTEATGLGGYRVPYFKTINLLPVAEAEARMAGLETGEFDYAESIPNTSYDRIADNSDLYASIVKPRWSVTLELNHKNFPTSDVNFRKALVYALDMEKVLVAVSSGNTEFYRLDPSIYTPEQYYYTTAGSEDIYNKPDQAKVTELLAAAGYNGETVTYLCNKDFDFMYKACLSVSEQLTAAGINVELEFSDWSSQISKAQSLEGWNINQTGLSPRLAPTQLNSSLNSAAAGAYGYNNPEMDELLKQVGMGNTNEGRKAIWEQIQKLVWDDVAIIKIGDSFELEAINSKYDGYTSFYLPRFWNVYEK
jgi:peptide/nickel transport system substrate-binding protein